MILVRLFGGLGNQLFQYALGRRLAFEHDVPLRFDISLIGSVQSERTYRLDQFHVTGCPVSNEELEKFNYFAHKRFICRLDKLIQQSLPYYRRRKIFEKQRVYDPNILKSSSNVMLNGYWQSEKYFSTIRPQLLQELTLKEPFNEINQQISNQIADSQAVSLHIRRGDYVANPKTNKVHGVLPITYYQKAMYKIEETVSTPHYYVFSDDIPWAKENINAEHITFINHNGIKGDHLDLILMSQCKHHIIANSSFSWWAAWLATYPEKRVYAPHQWYQVEREAPDLIPTNWETI